MTITPEQVLNLNEVRQKSPTMHPYTCGNCRDTLGTRFMVQGPLGSLEPTSDEEYNDIPTDDLIAFIRDGKRLVYIEHALIATSEHWLCPTCGYTQEYRGEEAP